MKKFLAAALASMMLIGGAALALADGELNICSPNSDGLLSIIPVFEEQTGIKVKVESIGTGDCMKRIGSEIAQEYSTFDLMYGGSLANYVANADLFQDYVSDQDQYLMDAYKNTRGYCTNYTIDGSVLLVNTDMLKEMGIEVNGYADLLQPELVGKIASADPASSSSAFCQLTNMLLAMGGYEDDAAWQYVQDLFVGQQVAITSGSSAVYKGVYNGEYAVGLTYEDPCVTLIKDGATNIKVVYPVEGTVFLPAQIGIVKNAKNVENAKAFVDFMLSEEAQRFLAENTQRIAQLKRTPVYSRDDCTSWWITDGLRIWDATPKEKEKIPAVVLTASLIRNPDERLQALADELNERYGGSWLMPVFMKAIITQPKEQVYETYSPLLDTPQKGYLFHALGMLHYRCYPEGWIYERLGPDGMIALIFWGDYSYGTYDTRFMIERYVDLDERWLFDLAKDPEGRKPTVTWQTYNRGGVLYGSYDEMFISLLPRKVENPELKRILRDYFRIRSEKVKVEESITVYKDATERFGD